MDKNRSTKERDEVFETFKLILWTLYRLPFMIAGAAREVTYQIVLFFFVKVQELLYSRRLRKFVVWRVITNVIRNNLMRTFADKARYLESEAEMLENMISALEDEISYIKSEQREMERKRALERRGGFKITEPEQLENNVDHETSSPRRPKLFQTDSDLQRKNAEDEQKHKNGKDDNKDDKKDDKDKNNNSEYLISETFSDKKMISLLQKNANKLSGLRRDLMEQIGALEAKLERGYIKPEDLMKIAYAYSPFRVAELIEPKFSLFQEKIRPINLHTDLKPGQHVFCYRLNGSFTHHGICVETDDKKIIIVHYNGDVSTGGHWALMSILKKLGVVSLKIFDVVHKFRKTNNLEKEIIKAGKSVAYVMPSSILEFANGAPIFVAKYKYEADYPIVLMRANRLLWKGDYNFVQQNCEHFATYCKTGLGKSLQSEAVAEKLNKIGHKLAKWEKKVTNEKVSTLLKDSIRFVEKKAGDTCRSVNFLAQ